MSSKQSKGSAGPEQSGQAPRVIVIIPALDEEQALPLVLEELPAGALERVIVVDNGSTDRTAEFARDAGALVVPEPRRGYGQACLTGLASAFAQHDDPELNLDPGLADEDIVVFLDGDHSDYPEDLPQVLAPILDERAEMVIGSRVRGGASMKAMLPQAWFGNRLACGLMRLFFGLRASDLGPFRAIRVSALRHLKMEDRDFGWTVEMQLKAHVTQLRVVEIPVRYRPRIGQSKITGTISGTVRAGIKIIGWIVGWRLKLWMSRGIPRYPGSSQSARQ